MSLRKLLTDRATIERLIPLEPVDDGYGNVTTPTTWGVIASDVPCKMTRSNHDLIQSPSYQTLKERWDVVFLPSVDVKETDRIRIDGIVLEAGYPERVRNHHLDVPCMRDVAL
ncbi:DUF3599 family protein [Exiguobacterium sp. s21]|uniref:DUF3599 family protein n=1 Tax=Exiguobacterium sp. s21 TaxID=2751244 RepID=UPI001BEC3082|nr:DUF3599 family protein [Exiguobacterium sp. s21]